MRNTVQGRTYDAERALYAIADTDIIQCTFAGPADGESAMKESRRIAVEGCTFSLRYPLWHSEDFVLRASSMDEKTRAAIWYACDGKIENCTVNGVKCLRECDRISIADSRINSPEFGWRCRDIKIDRTELAGEYLLFESKTLRIDRLQLKGKYSFQYTENGTVTNSALDTKDAFWHCHNVTVRNSELRGEYLGWYSDGLTLIDCHINGTQPFCYCKNLTLVNCTMENTDLAFEYSDVQADIRGNILSVKNPRSGSILADSFGEIITENAIFPLSCEIHTRT